MEDDQKKSITEQILSSVKSGQIKMRPKWHFILRAFLWISGTAIVTLALLYLASLIMFIARKTGIWAAPIFGWHGVMIFLVSLPWMLVLAVLFFIVVLEMLVRHYSFAYRLPFFYSALGVLLVVVAGGLIVARTPLHQALSNCPPGGGPPPCGGGFYHDLAPHRFDDIHRGVIDMIMEPNFTIVNDNRERLFIIVSRRTRLPFGEDFSVGDTVVVIGDRHGDQVEAFGVSEAGDY